MAEVRELSPVQRFRHCLDNPDRCPALWGFNECNRLFTTGNIIGAK
jgi:hypothetical protein